MKSSNNKNSSLSISYPGKEKRRNYLVYGIIGIGEDGIRTANHYIKGMRPHPLTFVDFLTMRNEKILPESSRVIAHFIFDQSLLLNTEIPAKQLNKDSDTCSETIRQSNILFIIANPADILSIRAAAHIGKMAKGLNNPLTVAIVPKAFQMKDKKQTRQIERWSHRLRMQVDKILFITHDEHAKTDELISDVIHEITHLTSSKDDMINFNHVTHHMRHRKSYHSARQSIAVVARGTAIGINGPQESVGKAIFLLLHDGIDLKKLDKFIIVIRGEHSLSIQSCHQAENILRNRLSEGCNVISSIQHDDAFSNEEVTATVIAIH